MFFSSSLKPESNEDESRWELAGESLHECFFNSHCSVKQAVRVAWELTRVFLLFSISLFLLVASPLLFLRFLTLVKLLTVRVITPTVTCRCCVIFSFFLLFLMGNDLEITCFCNSLRLSCNSHDRSNDPNLSLTLIKIWTSSKLMRECMKVDESWWSNESESCDSHPLSFSFDQALKCYQCLSNVLSVVIKRAISGYPYRVTSSRKRWNILSDVMCRTATLHVVAVLLRLLSKSQTNHWKIGIKNKRR